MAKFFVGQRVRIIGCRYPENRHLIGSETVIKGAAAMGYWVCELNGLGDCWAANDLEPILPDGHRASTESFKELMDRLNTQRVERVA